MKVNISGVGLIPRVGLIAPVYGKDLSKDIISVILNYASFKVYVAATGVCITKKNIDEIFGEAVKKAATPIQTTPKKTVKFEEVVPVTPEVAEATSLPNVEEIPSPSSFEPIPEITEENVDEINVGEPVVEVSDPTEIPAEEVPVVRPTYTNNKKKKRH